MKVYIIMGTDICFTSEEDAKKYVETCWTLDRDDYVEYVGYEDIQPYNIVTLDEAVKWLKS